jgi:putative transposase
MAQNPIARPDELRLAARLSAFSVSPADSDALRHYIDHQAEHHRHWTFQDEYRTFLHKYGIDYDERYVWD